MTQIEPHNAEIWTCAFDFHDPSILYSGADDTFFKATDLRCNETVMLKKFGAGVCTIAPYIFDQNVIMVGGYDEKAWFFDKRNLKDSLNSLNVKGGVWRAKWNRMRAGKILLCGMRSGYHVVGNPLDRENPTVQIYDKHKTDPDGQKAANGFNAPLCYAADWVFGQDESKVNAVSSSFYEKEVHVWGF